MVDATTQGTSANPPTDNGTGPDIDPTILAELLGDSLRWIMDRADDCTRLAVHGFLAIYVEGPELLTKRVLGGSKDVLVVQRPGAEGAAFGLEVKRQLEAIGWKGTLRRCSLPDPFFDLAILERETGDTDRFKAYIAGLAASGMQETLPTDARGIASGRPSQMGRHHHRTTPSAKGPC